VHRYRVYGLSIEAEFALPELAAEPAVAEPDVRIRKGASSSSGATTDGRAAGSWVQRLGETAILTQFEGVGRFVALGGRDVLVDPEAGADPAHVRHLLLGPVLAQVLWQRAKFVLHGCVLGVGARCFAFLGASGAGKSTLALALHRAGHTLVCDDVAALEWEQSPVLVHPALPRMRAHADSLHQVGESLEGLPRAYRDLDKWLLPARQFASGARPLDELYVLADGDHFSVEPLSRAEAMIELMRHTYHAEHYTGLHGAPQHMKVAGALANAIPARRLTRPKDWSRLEDLVRFIEGLAQKTAIRPR
jgi:hypothetical protein